MIQRLEEIQARFNELERQLATPEVATHAAAAASLLKEMKELRPVVEAYRRLLELQKRAEEATAMLKDADEEVRELAHQELVETQSRIAEMEDEIKSLLLPKDPDDDRNAILEIRAGTGGEEAALFAADLLRMYSRFIERCGWKQEYLTTNPSEAGGFKEVVLLVSGPKAYGMLKWESGVHRVQRVPVTESQGRIHTSAATVAVLPEAEDIEVLIEPDDLKVEVFRAQGAGGQYVNTTDSAVRITHTPTGITVSCQDERSQYKNKAKAMKLLQARLLAKAREDEAAKIAATRRSQVRSGDRSEKIRTYNFPQNRVTDHRINLTLHRLDDILDGNLTQIIESLSMHDRAEKLKVGSC
jgi:peptide chain release factor 1